MNLGALASATARFITPRPRAVCATVGCAAAVVVLLFRLALPGVHGENESVDYSHFYRPVARSIAAGHGIVSERGGPLAIRYPPGYPAVLAAVYLAADALRLPEATAMALFTAACAGAAALFLYLLARHAWPPMLALLPPLLWIGYLPALWLFKQPNSEVPFVVVLYGLLLLAVTAWRRPRPVPLLFLAVGLLAGAAMLMRPIALGLGVVLAGAALLLRRDWRLPRRLLCAAALLAGNALAVAPWELHVWAKTTRVILLGSGDAAALRDGLTYAVHLKGFRVGTPVPEDVATVMRRLLERYDEFTTPGAIFRAVGDEFRRDPVAVVKLYLIKAARSWYGTDSQRFEGALLLIQLPYLALVAAAFLRLRRAGGPDLQRLGVVIGLVTVYFWGMNVLSTTLARYSIPVLGLLFVLVPAALPAWCDPGRLRARAGARERAREPAQGNKTMVDRTTDAATTDETTRPS